MLNRYTTILTGRDPRTRLSKTVAPGSYTLIVGSLRHSARRERRKLLSIRSHRSRDNCRSTATRNTTAAIAHPLPPTPTHHTAHPQPTTTPAAAFRFCRGVRGDTSPTVWVYLVVSIGCVYVCVFLVSAVALSSPGAWLCHTGQEAEGIDRSGMHQHALTW